MKFLLFLLIFCSCSYTTKNEQDAGIFMDKVDIKIQHKKAWVSAKYFSRCVNRCINFSDDTSWCRDKCINDLVKINKVLEQMMRENKEKEFDDLIEPYYGKIQ